MAEKKPVVSEKLRKKGLRYELGGMGLMSIGVIELALTALSPLLGVVAILIGLGFFNKGRKLVNGKK